MDFEAHLFYFINKALQNKLFDFVMPIIAALGSGEFMFAIAILLLLAGFRKKENAQAGILLLAGLTTTYYAVTYLKHWIARPRPFAALTGVHLIGNAGAFSFPSGHATVAFLGAVILSRYFKRFAAVFYSLAILICFARVYVGVHYISDVLSGAALGSLIGFMLVKIQNSFY